LPCLVQALVLSGKFQFTSKKLQDFENKSFLITRLKKANLAARGSFRQQFTNSFYLGILQKCKKSDGSTVFFALLGSADVKTLSKMLVKLTTVLVINKLWKSSLLT
jgi:hypothetical protein